tara:strand:+ start:12141 stop:12536 length:396 start_codon:yes stop_codon:yes gene_type:complete
LFYSRTKKKKKCQLRGSVKTPKGDIMRWTKKQISEYMLEEEIYLTYREPNRKNRPKGTVITYIWSLHNKSGYHKLDKQLFNTLGKRDLATIRSHLNGTVNYFEFKYNQNLKNYNKLKAEASKNAVATKDVN